MAERQEMRAKLNEVLEIVPERTAVLAIDTHRGHLDPEIATMPVAADLAARIVDSSARLLKITRAAGIATIFVVMTNRIINGKSEYLSNPFWRSVDEVRESLTPDLPSTIAGHNLVGSPQTQVMPELEPGEDDIVIESKHRLSSFVDTELEGTLRQLGIDTLLLIGINTNTCVQCAAFDGFNRDFRIVLVSDCVGSSYGDDLHEFGLQNVARCLGWVQSTDEIAERLSAPLSSTAGA
ncbi:cysteine hydrolase [Actinomadura graeca]|uniref:Cysteine hydrolase n=1 Tax=Actinomadura graeca TaxID=2750812 RepID=A0ABX8QXV5_9ACTN|nr:cysteine hydrolase [Actinomadura graeca]QXJ22552.1 cysteine hydrolase [Actinomadura graeca]